MIYYHYFLELYAFIVDNKVTMVTIGEFMVMDHDVVNGGDDEVVVGHMEDSTFVEGTYFTIIIISMVIDNKEVNFGNKEVGGTYFNYCSFNMDLDSYNYYSVNWGSFHYHISFIIINFSLTFSLFLSLQIFNSII